jgi:hypothetical protein
MSDTVLKRLNVSDVFTIPYEANKLWSVTSSNFEDYGIFIETGSYTSSLNKLDYTYSDLLYKSVLVNYYPTFYPTFSHSTASYSQTIYWSTNLSTASYSGFLNIGNQATTEKHFYTSSIKIINIPSSLYSNKIVPTTFKIQISGGLIYDDGEYNLRWSGSNQSSSIGNILSQSSYVGNLFYEQGLGVLTDIPLITNNTTLTFSNIPTTMSSDATINSSVFNDAWFLGSNIINGKPYWSRQSFPNQIIAWDGNKWIIQNSPYSVNFFYPVNTDNPELVFWSYSGTPPGLNSFYLSGSNPITYNFISQSTSDLTNYISSIEFKNSYTLYEQNMVCRVKDYEFNVSYNPTLTTGTVGFIYESASLWITSSTIPYNYTGTYYTYPDDELKDFATASYFSPYVGSIGFYNDSNQLLAVAKMSQPVPLSNETDLTFLVKLDW